MSAGGRQERRQVNGGVQEGVWATQWSFKKWKSDLHEVNKQGKKMQHERRETGSQQETARLGRNENKQ